MIHVRKFLFRFALFVLLNVLFWWVWFTVSRSIHATQIVPSNSTTQSHLFVIPEHKKYDLVILGSSHAERLFGGTQSQSIAQSMLGMSFFSLAKNGAGILPEKVYLYYFFERRNQAERIVYFIDPFVFHSPKWNEQYSFNYEPYRNSVLVALIGNHFDRSVLYGYIKSNFDPRRILSPQKSDDCIDSYSSLSQDAMNQTISNYYDQGLDQSLFNTYASELADEIEISQSHNARVLFILPPNLWVTDPGKKMLLDLLQRYKEQYGIEFYDLSNSVPSPKLYSSTASHLNCQGVQYFTEHFLKSILTQ